MLIGREKEIDELRQAYDSDESRFVAVFGRRRIGKTYLVREVFHDKFAFTYSGIANASTKEQLQRFYLSLKDHGYKNGSYPNNWIEAFYMLEQYLKELSEGKKVVFLDELPWMDAPKSSFMPAFENFWNGWASARKDIFLIVCGSATSWMVKKILRNRGGLHNRLNNQIHLQPFNLYECELYARNIDLPMERAEIMEAYICIITALAKKKIGMTRDEIIESANLITNGQLTKYLEDLENCGFIRKYQAIGSKTKNSLYQLIDNFTLFYFKFMEGRKNMDANYWSKIQMTSIFHAWSGLAFERLCLLHSEQIKKALEISGVITNEYSWRTAANDEHPGAQIDLLIDRSDKAINLCEIKYSDGPYTIDKKYMENLRNKVALFRQLTKTRKGIALTMITSSGLVKNSYSMNNVHSQLTADDLFVGL